MTNAVCFVPSTTGPLLLKQQSRRERKKTRHYTVIRATARHNNDGTSDGRMSQWNEPPPGPPPGEADGFLGWRKSDDEYWLQMRRYEKMLRGPHIPEFDPESASLDPPLGRDGKPIRYPGAVYYDQEKGKFVPISEEEEAILRSESPIRDPFYVEEAPEGVKYRADCSRSTFSAEEVIRFKHVSYRVEKDGEYEDNDVWEDGPETNRGYTVRRIPADAPPPTRRIGYSPQLAPTKRRPLRLAAGEWRMVHLGTSSAVPTRLRNVSSTAFLGQPPDGSAEPNMVLVDAGENTEKRLLDAMWSMSHGFRWLRAVVITHLHGDHIYGLPGLLRAVGEYCQHRRRDALETGVPDPIIRIVGPYGTRSFLRTSLYWTNPIGVRFSVAELVPRELDFQHITPVTGPAEARMRNGGGIFTVDMDGKTAPLDNDDPRFADAMAPPHPEEVRVDDIHAEPDGTWRVWGDADDPAVGFELVAAPLKHRLPCFGYVFRGPKRPRTAKSYESNVFDEQPVYHVEKGKADSNGVVPQSSQDHPLEIDLDKARELGVYGSQFRVLRDGRSITVRKTGRIVTPEDVRKTCESVIEEVPEVSEVSTPTSDSEITGTRKVVILGDTCDSTMIADAAMGADLLMHEATFDSRLKAKADHALHSTAGMAGSFAGRIRAKKLVLTHFSSRYEAISFGASEDIVDNDNSDEDSDDLISAPRLIQEAAANCKAEIIAAQDYMEHTIETDGTVTTKDRVFNRYAVVNANRDFYDESMRKQDKRGTPKNSRKSQDGVSEERFEESIIEESIIEEKSASESLGAEVTVVSVEM
eukprot:IDg2593t1